MKRLTDPVLIVASPGEASNIRYACGFNALDPMIFLQQRGKQYLVVPPLELGRAKKEARRATIFAPQDLPIAAEKRRSVSAWALGLLQHLHVKRVVISPSFPSGTLRFLEKNHVAAAISEHPVFPERAIKTAREIGQLREAQRAAVAAMNAAVSVLRSATIRRDGFLSRAGRRLTAEDVRFAVEVTLLKHGCAARDTIIAAGRQAADPHDRGHGPLRAGQTIVLDIFPQHKTHGYWGDITRTVLKGEATEKQRAMYRAVREAQQVALSMIRPGVMAKKIHEAVQDVFGKRGFETSVKNGVARGFFHGTGHGVGLDIHELPSVGVSEARLEPGHVITVEPGLYYPEHGGVRIEDTVVVTSRGFEFLATCKKQFELP